MEAVLRRVAGLYDHGADGGPASAFSEAVRRVPRPRGSRSNGLARRPVKAPLPGRAVARHSAPERRAALEHATGGLETKLRHLKDDLNFAVSVYNAQALAVAAELARVTGGRRAATE